MLNNVVKIIDNTFLTCCMFLFASIQALLFILLLILKTVLILCHFIAFRLLWRGWPINLWWICWPINNASRKCLWSPLCWPWGTKRVCFKVLKDYLEVGRCFLSESGSKQIAYIFSYCLLFKTSGKSLWC